MRFLQSEYYYFVFVSMTDILLVPLLFLLAIVVAYLYASKRRQKDEYYRYLPWGVAFKLLSVIAFCFVYLIFYEGDTLDYYNSAVALNNVASYNFSYYLDLMIHGNQPEYWSYFNSQTGFVESHMFRDPNTFFVIRLISPLVMISGESFLISSMIMALFSFVGIWKFYRLLNLLYPTLYKYSFFAALLIPSVLFWGSGILKDSITMSSTAWITYSIFMVIFIRRKIIINLIIIIFLSYFIISIKPYIFISLVPGLLIWVFFNQVKKIRNKLLRFLTIPLTGVVVLVAASLLLSYMGQYLGVYGDVDSMITKVKVTQEDLLRSTVYGSNSYNIGIIDPTPMGLLSKAPAAIVAGLFRPFLWEARNPFVIISGLENLAILLLLVFIMIKVGILNFFRAIIKDPFLTYALVFALLFAFGVGLASTNFGALVRYRIPMMPFLVSGLFILLQHYRERRKRKENAEQNDAQTPVPDS